MALCQYHGGQNTEILLIGLYMAVGVAEPIFCQQSTCTYPPNLIKWKIEHGSVWMCSAWCLGLG